MNEEMIEPEEDREKNYTVLTNAFDSNDSIKDPDYDHKQVADDGCESNGKEQEITELDDRNYDKQDEFRNQTYKTFKKKVGKRENRKDLRNISKEYLTDKGKIIRARQPKLFKDKCRRMCKDKITEETSVTRKKLLSDSGIPLSDGRGKHEHKNKITISIMQHVYDHINRFPAYESHYSRKHTSKKYSVADLTKSKMYTLYTQEVPSSPMSLEVYSQAIDALGFKFKKPSNDTCKTCDIFQNKIRSCQDADAKTNCQQLLQEHHDEAEATYETKRIDKLTCSDSKSQKLLLIDLQQVLLTCEVRLTGNKKNNTKKRNREETHKDNKIEKDKFIVAEMAQEKFFDFESLLKGKLRTKTNKKFEDLLALFELIDDSAKAFYRGLLKPQKDSQNPNDTTDTDPDIDYYFTDEEF
ncbi:unnamed protein product [Psylliodes chrysocephalus]|uniref:Uncharacterized protein n=1 Tax=Psylliodes chrysocephalus TaxID=3402493 RepID=A0A9P0GI52_9CUCU|nr:unnamed protein product [Psylliodes chrysocephala]